MTEREPPTQYRPPYTGDPNASRGRLFEFNRPTVISLLYLANFFTGFSVFVGLILAFVWKNEPHEPWEATHHTYLIRTFWIPFVVLIAGLILALGLLGVMAAAEVPDSFWGAGFGIFLLIFPALAIWFGVRCILSLIRAQNHDPMPRPKTWLF